MNWRKPAILSLLRVSGSSVPGELALINDIERAPDRIANLQQRRLSALLRHAWEQVPYYRDVLEACGAVRVGRVNLDRFTDIPFLTKEIIRAEGDRLRAKTLPEGRKAYPNSTGGSTGQPVSFWQDNRYWQATIATRLYIFKVVGKELGERELKIWGSERDLFEGTLGWKAGLQNWLYNRRFQQCFHLPEERILRILHEIDTWRPRLLFCYRDGIDAVARYVNERGLRPHSPAAVVLGGATVYPHIAETIERAFRAPVISAYGSREMGAVACQCLERGGHHIASHSHLVETIGPDGAQVAERDGEVVVTSLLNYAMPFIRYKIGDRGRLTAQSCPCGRGFPLLASLSGRMIEVLVNSRGEQVDPIYFIHLVGVVFNRGFVRKFQVVQEVDGGLTIPIVLEPGFSPERVAPNLDEVREKVALVMGPDCRISFEFVSDIPLAPSGKHQYVVRRQPAGTIRGR